MILKQNPLLLLHQLNLAKKTKAEREFIKEEKRRNAAAFQAFLTQRNFLYVEYLLVRFSWGSNNIKDFYGEPKHITDICLIIFSIDIHNHLLNTYPCEKIGTLSSCNGDITIYKMNYKGRDIAFYLTGIGSALASAFCYEAHWQTGAAKFIMFGSCGSLDREKTEGKFIIPTESYRGEGYSYYFAEPADYIEIKNSKKL